VIDVGYVGAVSRHLLWARNLNAIPFGTTFKASSIDPTNNRPLPQSFLSPYQGYNNINMIEPAATSNYNSLQVSANRRYAKSFQYGAAWTWSKTMDFNDADNNVVSTFIPVRVWNYGLASFDRTHTVKINWLYDVPKAPFRNRVIRTVLNEWQVSGIASFISGQPLGVTVATTPAVDFTGSPTDAGVRAVMTGNPVLPKGDRTFNRYFDTSVFLMPAIGTVGNAARTVLRGPGTNNWDTAIYKQFPIRDRFRLQFRWELYNIFNHTQFTSVDTTARYNPTTGAQINPTFGQLTAAASPRIMQFALRFYF